MAERFEVHRLIPASPDAFFRVLYDAAGHVAIDSSGMLMSSTRGPVAAVGDSFVVHMGREALNDRPLELYDVTVSITDARSARPDRPRLEGRPTQALLGDPHDVGSRRLVSQSAVFNPP